MVSIEKVVEIMVNIIMLCAPSVIACLIHYFLRQEEMSFRRKSFFYIVYVVLINMCVLAVSAIRGVIGLQFIGMTLSYKIKYIGLGSVFGFIVPFPVCILLEKQVSIEEMGNYIKRLLRDLKSYFAYAIKSAKADLHAEVANSYLSWLWWLIEPICMMIIYTFIFGLVFQASEPYFPIFVFIGITMWNFFQRSVSGSVNIVKSNKGIITKIYMPKYILLLSRMFVYGFKMMVSFGIVVAMMLLYHVKISIYVLYAVPILVVLFMFTFGISCIMMHYGVYVSDLAYIVGIVLTMLMYLTGVFYSLGKKIPAPFGTIMEEANPVAFLIRGMRDALLYGEKSSGTLLLAWGGISLILIIVGTYNIYNNENAYVKVI